MSQEQTSRTQDEPVGYGSPPVKDQFPNNPKRQVGRKKGSKNKPKLPPEITDSERIALEEGDRLIGPEGGQITTAQAVHRAQFKTAAQGGTNAQRAFLDRLDRVQRKQREATEEKLAYWENYVQVTELIIERSDAERRAYLDRILLPHPHDVEVDWQKREVRVLGPANALERRKWRECVEELEKFRPEIIELRAENRG